MTEKDIGLISERTFREGAIEAVKSMLTAKIGVGTDTALQTKAIVWAILELAEQTEFLRSEMKKIRTGQTA